MGYFRAIAVDLDGTLAYHDEVAPEILEALRELRGRGIRAILVTGRILAELRQTFPELEADFDLVVAENGTVISSPTGTRDLAEPVDPQLLVALSRRDIPVRLGRVLVACGPEGDDIAAEEIRRGGYEYQLVRNRGALMVLPTGRNKGTGVMEGLGDLGISRHSTVALGDAENDHSLLEACELGAAVVDAVPALREHADLVLDEPGPPGLVRFLRGPLLMGDRREPPSRWQVRLGTAPNGASGCIPASQVNLMIAGGTTSGKSYLAGLAAEQLINMGYSVVVFDLEGDHTALGQLRGALDFDSGRLPDPDKLKELVKHRFSSVILDLSLQDPEARNDYVRRSLDTLASLRTEVGLPHWIFLEEAHHILRDHVLPEGLQATLFRGLCLVTWRPSDLSTGIWEQMDAVAALPGREVEAGGTPQLMAHLSEKSEGDMLELLEGTRPGDFLLHQRDSPGKASQYTMGERATDHVRHWRKYADAELPPGRGFFFHTPSPEEGLGEASNLRQFVEMTVAATDPVIRYHSDRSDFSRWIRRTVRDSWLASAVAAMEEEVRDDGSPDELRRRLLKAVRRRYGA